MSDGYFEPWKVSSMNITGSGTTIPVGKYLFKVSKITLEQRSDRNVALGCVILLTLNRYLPTGKRLQRK